jgi:hypothetical protein
MLAHIRFAKYFALLLITTTAPLSPAVAEVPVSAS